MPFPFRRLRLGFLPIILLLSPTPTAWCANQVDISDKAAFLVNLFRFIDWPEGIVDRHFVLCVTSTDPGLIGALAAYKQNIRGKTLLIRPDAALQDLKQCQMVFVDKATDITPILQAVNNAPVVTVSEHPGFANHGGMIGMFTDGDRLGFNVNLELASAERIHISAQLLILANHVYPPKR